MIELTATQEKVIKDKYLKGNEKVDEMFERVARNISLAEVLYDDEVPKDKILNKVNHRIIYNEDKTSFVILFEGKNNEERESNFFTFLSNLEKIYEERKKVYEKTYKNFYNMMSTFKFLPNSPTLMNAGRHLQQLSACFVIPIEDNIESILYANWAQGIIQKSGGGTGFSFGNIRMNGDKVKKTGGIASGAVTFMQLFDKMTDVIKQGGTRRGANMGILPYWHPEIVDFIKLKSKPGVMENFNISVALDDKFMKALENGEDIDLINPRDKSKVGKINSKELFNMIVENAWKTGDPGVIFLDIINENNPTPHLGKIEATNPCGEQPLLGWESCNLGSINLSKFVKGELFKGKIDWDDLRETVHLAVRFLDNVIDVNNYPLPEIEYISKTNRKIGLGIMGWAETCVKLGIKYDSEEGLNKAREIMRFIQEEALNASSHLALERGEFLNWKGSIYDKESKYFKGINLKVRNASRTTIAPTGTISLAAGLQGSGIEPFFALSYVRYNARALEALKEGRVPDEKDTYIEVNPLFEQVAKEHNYFGLKKEELRKKIEANHKSIRGLKEVPQEIQDLFPTAHDINFEYHVRVQATFQEYTDNAVSKTINLRKDATLEDIGKIYLLAYKLRCKGITVYRDGCKDLQVLNLLSKPVTKKKLMQGISSEYYLMQTGYGPLHIHFNFEGDKILQVFSNLPPLGTELSGLTSLIGILLSKYFELGGDPIRIIKHLNSIKGDKPYGFGESKINSIPHAIAVAMLQFLKKRGENISLVTSNNYRMNFCPKCYSMNVSYESGCSGVTCHDCGYSECS